MRRRWHRGRSKRVPVGRKIRLILAVLGASLVLSAPATAFGTTTIDTTAAWDGAQSVFPFGSPDTATAGQVVTVPQTDTVLDRFTFYMSTFGDPAELTFRGEVYAWDGTKATGPNLWESSPRTLSVPDSFTPVTFNTGGVRLVAGKRYVLFVSLSKDYEQNAPGNQAALGWVSTNVYNGGGFVYFNDSGDESLWTTSPWQRFSVDLDDLAFKATFSSPLPTLKNQCMNGGWHSYGVFRNQGDCVSFVASGRKNPPAH
jgi:hypothetical protein